MAEDGERYSDSILAIEGETATAITFTFIAVKPTELYDAVKAAAREYLATDEGKALLKQTCGAFNWGGTSWNPSRRACASGIDSC